MKMKNDLAGVPYKIYLSENELPAHWYNVRADMKENAPLLDPATGKEVTYEQLCKVFCEESVKQELDTVNPLIPIPDEVRNFYRVYRPSPLVHAEFLEQLLDRHVHVYPTNFAFCILHCPWHKGIHPPMTSILTYERYSLTHVVKRYTFSGVSLFT